MFAVCLLLLMAALFLVKRDVERKASIYLAAFLVAACVAMIPQIIGFSGFYTVWPGLTFAPFATELYAGPLLYLHADRLMRGGPLGWRKWLLLPGILQTLYYSWAFLFLGDYQNKWAFNNAVHVPYVVPVETVIAVALGVLAMVAITRMIRRYKTFLENSESASVEFQPDWLQRMVIAVIVAGVFFLLLELIPLIVEPLTYVNAYPLQLAMMLILAWLGFDALTRLHLPFPKMPDHGPEGSASVSRQDDTDSLSTGVRDWQEQGRKISEQVLANQWFLEPRFSIRDLAARVGSNETYISRALNQGLNVTFNRFINAMRVDCAKVLLADPEQSVLSAALDSGFNSKATFNRVFRDHTKMTPSQYKKSLNTSQNP